jgi:hypothetical protein
MTAMAILIAPSIVHITKSEKAPRDHFAGANFLQAYTADTSAHESWQAWELWISSAR